MPKTFVNAVFTYTSVVEVHVPVEKAELEILRNPDDYTEEVYQAVREAFKDRADEIVDNVSEHLSNPMYDIKLLYAEELSGETLFDA